MIKRSEKNNNIEPKIQADQIEHVFRPFMAMLISNTILSVVVLLIFLPYVSQTIVFGWFVVMQLVTFFRLVIYIHYHRHFTAANVDWYARYFTMGSFLYGVLYGAAGVIFFVADNDLLQILLLVILLGAGAAGVITKIGWLQSLHAYLPISLIPMTVMLLTSGEQLQLALALSIIAFLIVTYFYAISANRDLIESFKLRYENIELLEQLREQKNEAEKASIAKSKFLAVASHDLRQPLHALTLFTSVLNESIQYPKVRKVVDQINASVDALQNLFNALLDISRLDAGVIQVEKTKFYLQPLFNKLVNDFEPLAQEKGLQINCPPCDYAVQSDLVQLEQILRNYISNAIRYTSKGSIKICCVADAGNITIHVIDTGLGIDEKNQHLIFDEFYQLTNPERDRSKGLGLGLAIVHRTAKLLDHPIYVDSQFGKGSTFSVCIPQAHNVEVHDMDSHHIKLNHQPVSNELIVVIDDEASIREGMQSLLEQWGYQVISAADEEQVLNLLRQQNRTPDGIIADYRLRDYKTGIDVIYAIHDEYNKEIPALIVTGDIAADRLREVNASDFQVLHKPVAPVKLRTFVRHIHFQGDSAQD